MEVPQHVHPTTNGIYGNPDLIGQIAVDQPCRRSPSEDPNDELDLIDLLDHSTIYRCLARLRPAPCARHQPGRVASSPESGANSGEGC